MLNTAQPNNKPTSPPLAACITTALFTKMLFNNLSSPYDEPHYCMVTRSDLQRVFKSLQLLLPKPLNSQLSSPESLQWTKVQA